MKKYMFPVVAALTIALLLSTAILASAAKPENPGGGPKFKGQNPATAVSEEPALSLLEQVEAVRATLPGKGKAWGRIANEVATEKAPGNIAALIAELKQLFGAEDPEEKTEEPVVVLPAIDEPVNVTVASIELDAEGNPTGMITIEFAAVEGEEPLTFILPVDADLLAQLESGTVLVLSLDEDGELVIAVYEEPAEVVEDEVSGDEIVPDDTDADTDEEDGTL